MTEDEKRFVQILNKSELTEYVISNMTDNAGGRLSVRIADIQKTAYHWYGVELKRGTVRNVCERLAAKSVAPTSARHGRVYVFKSE